MRFHVGYLFCACLLFHGCSEPSTLPPGVSVRDSLGIEIVHTSASVWESGNPPWSVSSAPLLQIGELEGSEENLFSSLVDVEFGEAGQIWVADAGINSIRIFDVEGSHMGTIGGEGEGPGEFRALEDLHRTRDGMMASQGARRPAHVFHLSGALQRTVRFAPRADLAAPFLIGVVEEDTANWAALSHHPQGEEGRLGLYEVSEPIYADLMEGDSLRDFGRFQAGRFVGVPGRRGTAYWQEYGPSLVMTTNPSGLSTCWSVDYSVFQYDARGQLNRILRRPWEPRPVSAEDRSAFEDSRLTFPEGRQPPPPILEFNRQVVEAMVFPENHPPLDRMLGDADGNLWVQLHVPHREMLRGRYPPIPADSTVWDVFNQRGAWLGSISLPGRFFVTSIGRDRLVGIWLGEFDVEYVRVYGIDKPVGR